MPNGWDAYIGQLMQCYSVKQEKYTRGNVCSSCAIIGHDGVVWAASDKWVNLSEYQQEVEELDGTKR